jgi:hypothetical protein
MSRGSSLSIEIGYGLDERGCIPDEGRYISPPPSRSVLGSTDAPVECILDVLSPEIKRPKCETDRSVPSDAKAKNTRSCTSTSPYVFVTWFLKKHRDTFKFIITLFVFEFC